jgi:hypothetical protein
VYDDRLVARNFDKTIRKMAERNMDRLRQVALVPFVLVAHVEHDQPVGGETRSQIVRGELRNGRPTDRAADPFGGEVAGEAIESNQRQRAANIAQPLR